MRRLVNILRQSQEECLDGDCITPQNISITSPLNAYRIGLIALLFTFAMVMFYTRPNSLRPNTNGKPRDGENSGGQPQPPPSVG
uniref:Small integral membrane protein 14 n=1 Tax=Panagrolaimus davidi TaxID=227884 RepID=A0A914PH48_9BILA